MTCCDSQAKTLSFVHANSRTELQCFTLQMLRPLTPFMIVTPPSSTNDGILIMGISSRLDYRATKLRVGLIQKPLQNSVPGPFTAGVTTYDNSCNFIASIAAISFTMLQAPVICLLGGQQTFGFSFHVHFLGHAAGPDGR